MNVTHPLTIRRIAQIEKATLTRALTAYELSDAIHICHQSALRYIRYLLGDNPLIGEHMHIANWRDIGPGKRVPLYLWGPGENKQKPAPMTRSEVQRKYRKRVRKDPERNAFYLAHQRARDRADRVAKAKPQTPFSTLFVGVRLPLLNAEG